MEVEARLSLPAVQGSGGYVYVLGYTPIELILRDQLSELSSSLYYGKDCYASTFRAMAISVWIACVMWIQAWKGKGGRSERGIAV